MRTKQSAVLTIPSHLSPEAKSLWRKLCDEWPLDDCASQMLLESALSSFDRWQSARKILARDGAVVRGRFGVLKTHPAVAVERDAKNTMRAALAALHLDFSVLRDGPGRPPGRKVIEQ